MLAALIHDLGKLLALVGNENDAHVDCMNRVIPGSLPAQEKGLDNIPIQWNHDEYGYQRLAAVLPRLPKRIRLSPLPLVARADGPNASGASQGVGRLRCDLKGHP